MENEIMLLNAVLQTAVLWIDGGDKRCYANLTINVPGLWLTQNCIWWVYEPQTLDTYAI